MHVDMYQTKIMCVPKVTVNKIMDLFYTIITLVSLHCDLLALHIYKYMYSLHIRSKFLWHDVHVTYPG